MGLRYFMTVQLSFLAVLGKKYGGWSLALCFPVSDRDPDLPVCTFTAVAFAPSLGGSLRILIPHSQARTNGRQLLECLPLSFLTHWQVLPLKPSGSCLCSPSLVSPSRITIQNCLIISLWLPSFQSVFPVNESPPDHLPETSPSTAFGSSCFSRPATSQSLFNSL